MGLLDLFKSTVSQPSQNAPKPTANQQVTITFTALPQSVAELQALPEAALDTPFKTAALTVCALCAYGDNPQVGIDLLNALKGPQPLTPFEQQFLKDRFMDGKKYIPFSYFAGSSPENDYTPSKPYTITISTNPYTYQDEGYAKVFLRSSGADNLREVKLRRKGEQWFLWEQFLMPGIREPKSQDPWA